jgi:hypothetical protein
MKSSIGTKRRPLGLDPRNRPRIGKGRQMPKTQQGADAAPTGPFRDPKTGQIKVTAEMGFAAHPRVRVGGAYVLTRPEAFLNEKEYLAEKAVYEWALENVQRNFPKIRRAYERMLPLRESTDPKTRQLWKRAYDAYNDALFRERWLRNGLVYIERLWDRTKKNLDAIRSLAEQAARAAAAGATAEMLREYEAKMRAEAEAAKQASATTTQELVQEDAQGYQTVPPPAEDSEAMPPDASDVPSPVEDAQPLAPEVKEVISQQYLQRMGQQTVSAETPAAASGEEPGFVSKYGVYIAGGLVAGLLYYNYSKNRG